MSDKKEVYITTANSTFQLSKVTGLQVEHPNESLGGYFNHWGLTLFIGGSTQVNERFETEGLAIDARTAIDDHLTEVVLITDHQRWDTLKKTAGEY